MEDRYIKRGKVFCLAAEGLKCEPLLALKNFYLSEMERICWSILILPDSLESPLEEKLKFLYLFLLKKGLVCRVELIEVLVK